MENNNPATASPARASPGLYGRACKPCSIAKARCVPSTDSSAKCQRCQRLGKSCEQTNTQRRKPDKKAGRVAILEEKLDSLVILLNNINKKTPVAESLEQLSSIPTPQSSSSTSSNIDRVQNLASRNSQPISDASHLEMRCGASFHLPEQGRISVPPFALTTAQEIDSQKYERANILLDRFRKMAIYFPFVIIPPTTDARALLRERPFLYRSIMAAAEQNPSLQNGQVKEIIQYLSLHLLQLGEKNLDLLLGVLVHVAWCHFHFHFMPRLTNLLHEALALLFDLGLNKAPSNNPRALVLEARYAERWCMLHPNTNRTLEERRAALGCFYVVSGAASYFQNIEPMRWSPYLEECLEELQKANEYDTDPSLINYVKMQHIVTNINSSPWFDDTDQSSGWKLYPAILYIRAIKAELRTLKDDLQTKFPQNPRMLSHYYSVEMTLYEIGLSKTQLSNIAHPSDFNRLEILYACLESVENFFENFLSIPPESWWNLSLIHFSQLAYALNILQRLSIFENPMWDLQYVAEKVNFVRVLEQVCNRMGEALRCGDISSLNGSDAICVFTRAATKLAKLKDMFEAQMASTQSAPETMGDLNTEDVMELENMVGFWEQDWFDIMGGNWGGV